MAEAGGSTLFERFGHQRCWPSTIYTTRCESLTAAVHLLRLRLLCLIQLGLPKIGH